nr:hypothetical protein [uncultured Bacteroides sp.]
MEFEFNEDLLNKLSGVNGIINEDEEKEDEKLYSSDFPNEEEFQKALEEAKEREKHPTTEEIKKRFKI